MFSFAITGKGEGVLTKSSIPFCAYQKTQGEWKTNENKWRLRLGGTAYLEHTGWIKEM